MSFENPEQIDGALQRLGSRLLYEYTDPIALVICGGSALNVLNVAQRTTRDVDVLAIVEETEAGIVLRPDRALPADFCEVVAWVAADLQLDEDWLNMGPKARATHLEDLIERIKPSEEEVSAAVEWLLDRKTSSQFRDRMRLGWSWGR